MGLLVLFVSVKVLQIFVVQLSSRPLLGENCTEVRGKVKSAYEPSGSPGRSLSRFL